MDPRASTERRATLAAALLLAGCACPNGGVTVRVRATDGSTELSVCAETTPTEADRARGLMGHAPLGPGQGMIFEFPVAQEICIWNPGVTFPIDVIYADAAGSVVAVERDVPAGDQTTRCHHPVLTVLEVAAGDAADVKVGDRLEVQN